MNITWWQSHDSPASALTAQLALCFQPFGSGPSFRGQRLRVLLGARVADRKHILPTSYFCPPCQDSHSGNFSKRLWRSCYMNWADNRWTLNLSKTYPKTGIVERSCNPRTPERDAGGCCKAQGQPGRGLPWLSKWTKQMICTVTHHPPNKRK